MNPQPPLQGTGTTRIGVDIRRYPGIRRLAGDYAHAFGPLAPFYAGNPSRAEDWQAAIERAQAHPRPRQDVADLISTQQKRRGAPPEARAALDQLRQDGTVAVVTGQQAGAFGGPLYTLLKAITALRLAARVRQEHQVPAVAVFWIDSEDHDWDEVASCSVLDGDVQPRTVRLPAPPGAGNLPVGQLVLDGGVSAVLDELAEALPPTEFTASLMTRLRSSYKPGLSASEAFGRLLEFTLGEFGLVAYDAADPAAKPHVREVFAREVQFPGRTAELALEAGSRLVHLGYHTQVVAHADGLSLFSLDSGRHPIRFADGMFRAGDRAWTQTALLAEVSANPAGFSPNVLLRPIVQDTLFPTVAYVAGPNELAYLGQLKPVYEHFGVPMPLMVPRVSATLLDSAGVRFLDKHEVGLEMLHAQDESVLNHLLETALPVDVDQAYQAAAAALDGPMQALVRAVPAIDATLEGAARSAAGRINHELKGLHTKIIHAAKRRDETLRRQFTRTRAQAFPGGQAQERAIGFVSFLNRYGPGLVDQLVGGLPIDPGAHWVVTV
ncbi:MAG: bacillithiol biosynthesis cysteine-adding enzyme BshC [Vicinamibacterales bacterium]